MVIGECLGQKAKLIEESWYSEIRGKVREKGSRRGKCPKEIYFWPKKKSVAQAKCSLLLSYSVETLRLKSLKTIHPHFVPA